MTTSDRIRRVLVSGEMARRSESPSELLAWLKTGGVPADAKIAGMKDDRPRDLIELFVTSESFDPVPEGEPIPEILVRWGNPCA